jgi:hypothetical protein
MFLGVCLIGHDLGALAGAGIQNPPHRGIPDYYRMESMNGQEPTIVVWLRG